MPEAGVLITVVPAGQNAPLCAFTARLTEAISAQRPARLLTIREHCGDGLTAYLAKCAPGGYVLAECEEPASPWTHECLRRATFILLVGSADGEPSINQIEREVWEGDAAKTLPRKELVLLHQHRKPYADTFQWLRDRKLHLHHHVALDQNEDFERLARILTGRGVGLVLSGGGARGFAHIGVIRALREHGIPIDLVGGTSMGACIGAQCALGWDYETMLERNRECWIRFRPLRDYTIPLVSLLTGKRMVRALTMMFGDTRIEDLPTSYFCVSSDLVRGETVVHRDGPLRKYIRASSSVAGIAPPVPDRGSLLVDGGVLNNLPADVMRKLHGGTIIAIDVNPYGYGSLMFSRDYGESLSARQILWSWLNPFGPKLRVPNIQAILERVTMLGGIRQANELLHGAMDLYIRPPTDEFGFLEMHKLDTIADIGYRFASVEIEAWKSHVTT
jgi:predicted acylesterase/phospholipase RssA